MQVQTAQIMRTTVNFDHNLYKQLTYDAAISGQSLSQLVNSRLLNLNVAKVKTTSDKSFADDWSFFRKMAAKYGNFNYGKALREERDRDNV